MSSYGKILVPAAAVLLVALAAWLWRAVRRWRGKDPDEIERLRRMDVHRRGRITAAEIIDLVGPEPTAPAQGNRRRLLVVYRYQVAGVTYEVSQDVSALPGAVEPGHWLSSESASVKYDPKAPTNSIIACEEWNGV
jgi:hypothetical protein